MLRNLLRGSNESKGIASEDASSNISSSGSSQDEASTSEDESQKNLQKAI